MRPDASWSLQPGVLGSVAVLAGAYVVGWRRARARAGARGADALRLAAALAGLVAVLVALVSPVDRLADQMLSMHMLQHLLLLDVAPVLVLLGLTKVLLRPIARKLLRVERAAGMLAHPAVAVALYVAGTWAWHAPALYDAAVRHPLVHVAEHLTFLAVGGLYWWHLLSPVRARAGLSGMGPTVYMASTKVLVGLLGVTLAFAPGVLYPHYAHQPRYWGLSAHDDQAAAGLLMALEQSLLMGIALAVLFFRALAESERREQRAERLLD
jgi:cytochrome c oxidase assembly factor CtaG